MPNFWIDMLDNLSLLYQYRLRRMVLTAFLLGALVSCSPVNSQCKQFANIVNRSQSFRDDYASDMEQALSAISSAGDLAEVKTSAKAYIAAISSLNNNLDNMIQDLGDLALTDDNLGEYRRRYILNLTGSKTSLTEAQDAMRLVAEVEGEAAFRDIFETFQTKADRAYSSIQSFNGQEAELLEQVNQFCSTESN